MTRPHQLTPEELESLGRRMSKLAAAADISPAELARRADLTDGSVRHYLAGRTAPALATLNALARALGVTPSQLLEGWPPGQPPASKMARVSQKYADRRSDRVPDVVKAGEPPTKKPARKKA